MLKLWKNLVLECHQKKLKLNFDKLEERINKQKTISSCCVTSGDRKKKRIILRTFVEISEYMQPLANKHEKQ